MKHYQLTITYTDGNPATAYYCEECIDAAIEWAKNEESIADYAVQEADEDAMCDECRG